MTVSFFLMSAEIPLVKDANTDLCYCISFLFSFEAVGIWYTMNHINGTQCNTAEYKCCFVRHYGSLKGLVLWQEY